MKKFFGVFVLISSVMLLLTGCGHEHEWAEATCIKPKTCTICKETEGEPLGHTWVEATCTEPKTCSVCGLTEGKANGHSWINATCTEPMTCSACGATQGQTGDHTWTAATCTTPKTCSVCGATEGDTVDHTWVAATCTTAKTCSVCGATDQDPLGHQWIAATTESPKTCAVCGATEGEPLTQADYVGTYTGSSGSADYTLVISSQNGDQITLTIEWCTMRAGCYINETTTTLVDGTTTFTAPVYGGGGANGNMQDFTLTVIGDGAFNLVTGSTSVDLYR